MMKSPLKKKPNKFYITHLLGLHSCLWCLTTSTDSCLWCLTTSTDMNLQCVLFSETVGVYILRRNYQRNSTVGQGPRAFILKVQGPNYSILVATMVGGQKAIWERKYEL